MKIYERKQDTGLSGSGLVTVNLIRTIEVPDGTKLSDGQSKAPDDAPLSEWAREEGN